MGSVTFWIGQIKLGEEAALEALLERYWPRLVNLARRELDGAPRRMADEEDIAQQAFWTFYRDFKKGQFPDLKNRHDLMSLLVIITAHNASDHIEHERALKRGGGDVRGESALGILSQTTHVRGGMDRMKGPDISPEEEAILKENYEHYLRSVPGEHRKIAEFFLAGWTQREIAEKAGCTLRRVERTIPLILKKWKAMAAEEVAE